MKRKSITTKIMALICVAAIVSALFAACGGSPAAPSSAAPAVSAAPAAPAGSSAPSAAAPAAPAESAPVEGKYKLLFGHTLTEQDPFHLAYLKWAEAVKERTNGELVLDVFANSQLGVEEDVLEQMKQGTNVGWQTDAARLGNYVNEYSVLLAPYFLENMDEVKKLIDSPTVANWGQRLENEHRIKVISFAYVQGYRNVFSNKKGLSPAEFQGMQIRTAGAPIWVAGVGSLGCTPVALPYGEIYNGVQTKVVDGCELPYIAANNLKIQEVAKYILETRHFYQNNFMVCSAEWFDALPAEYQTILLEECDKAGLAVSEEMANNTDAAKQAMIDAGMEYVPYEEMDIAAFKASSAKAYEELGLIEARDAIFAELGRAAA